MWATASTTPNPTPPRLPSSALLGVAGVHPRRNVGLRASQQPRDTVTPGRVTRPFPPALSRVQFRRSTWSGTHRYAGDLRPTRPHSLSLRLPACDTAGPVESSTREANGAARRGRPHCPAGDSGETPRASVTGVGETARTDFASRSSVRAIELSPGIRLRPQIGRESQEKPYAARELAASTGANYCTRTCIFGGVACTKCVSCSSIFPWNFAFALRSK
jgi:hypothetical protein